MCSSKRWAGTICTGPINPDGWSGSSLCQSRQEVKVLRPVGARLALEQPFRPRPLACRPGLRSLSSGSSSSPICRLIDRLTTCTSSVFSPGRIASVISTRYDGLPEDAQLFPVELHVGHHFDAAQIEHVTPIFRDLLGRNA